MSRSAILVAALAALSLAPLAAQQNIVYYPHGVPDTSRNYFPFGAGRNGVRQQDLIPGSVFGTTPVLIQDLYWCAGGPAPGNTLTEGEIVYGDFEIQMSMTTASTLTTSWTTNLPNPTTVYSGRLRLRWKNQTFTPIGLQQPFLWAPTSPGDNLVVDFILWNVIDTGGITPDVNGYLVGANNDSTAARCWRLGWPTNQGSATVGTNGTRLGFLLDDGNFVGRGFGCPTSANSRAMVANPGAPPTLGAAFSFDVRSAAPTVSALPLLGTSELTWGAIQLPLDLGVLRAPGCNLWIDPAALLSPVLTDPAGTATATVPVPNVQALLRNRVYASWLMLDPGANPASLVSSDYGVLVIGS